jgi:enamine deaminase RidA (YjgF/YER057c/UK114 family)
MSSRPTNDPIGVAVTTDDGPLRIPSPSRYAPVIGFSAAVRAGDWVVSAGASAIDSVGNLVGDGPYEQAREALRKIGEALAAGGASFAHVISTRTYLTRAEDWQEVGRAHGEIFGEIRPASTMVVVAALLDPRMVVEIEAVAFTGTTTSA